MSSNKICCVFFVIILFSNFSYSFGQSLALDDIFKIYSLDSIALKQFCIEKNFKLDFIDENDWVFEYSFQSNPDKKISVHRTFPKGEHAGSFVRYFFNDQQEYKNFESLIKARDFVRTKYKTSGKKIRTEISTKYYIHHTLKMEIGMEKHSVGLAKYALTLSALPPDE